MYRLEKEKLNDLYTILQRSYNIYGPEISNESNQVMFNEIDDIHKISITAPIPHNPPKDVLLPQMETIVRYDYNSKSKNVNIEETVINEPTALIGLKPCDLEGILCLDRFFLGQEYVDDVYLEHRKNLFIVTITCNKPYDQCFCVCTDSGPDAKENFDMNLTDMGDFYYCEIGSEKAEEVAGKLKLKKAAPEDALKKEEVVQNSIHSFDDVAHDNKAWISRVMNRITTGFIKPEVWEYIGNKCFECGGCSFVCPTCSCFNIEDVNDTGKIKDVISTNRIRTWDSCSFEGYTRMAGDHNPRKPVEDRRNKRFFCKLSYSQSKKYLRPGCVGCGRCARVCPGDIGLPNVVTYIRKEMEEANEQ